MATKNISIEYLGGSVTLSTYNAFSETQKQNYKAFLTSLSGINYSSARWILSEEIYIPSNVTLTIAQNVTLVANGGLFSGTGSIQGNKTKINAGFEQLFEETLLFPIQTRLDWIVGISHPEWFGDSSKTSDCSIKIQKAINLIITSFTDYYDPSNPGLGSYKYGGKIICKPYSNYLIKNTIYLNYGQSFDGGNSSFIYGFSSGDNYMFKLNLTTGGTVAISKTGNLDNFSNVKLINPQKINNAFGIYTAAQFCVYENIYSEYLCQVFKRYSSDYLDQITLRNFTIGWPQKLQNGESLYQIDTGSIGDALLIDNIHTYVDANGNQNLLRINECGGGVIQRIINGSILIKDSKSISLTGLHLEFGNITIENSQVEINGFNILKKKDIPPVIIKRRSVSYENRNVILKNGMFLYDHNKNDYQQEQTDVQIYGAASGIIDINHVYRCLQAPWTSGGSFYGIRINNDFFMKNPAANSISSIITGNGSMSTGIVKNNISYTFPNYVNILNSTIYLGKSTNANDVAFAQANNIIPAGTYQYSSAIIIDKDRNIGFDSYNNISSINVPSSTSNEKILFIRLNFEVNNSDRMVGFYIRIFRKNPNAQIEYVDLPICSTYNFFYDFGQYTNFYEKWKSISNLNTLRPAYCINYQNNGNNVEVTMNEFPTKGSWKKGDIVLYGTNSSILTSDLNL